MAKMKGGLGKGLNALIPEINVHFEEEKLIKGQIVSVDINNIKPNALQPRKIFDKEKLNSLIESIKAYGVIQPVVVRQIDMGYELIAGERRWKAARQAGLKEIPCVLKEMDERQRMEIALIENLQREDLNPIEEAMAFKTLMETYGLTQEDISISIGKSRPHIANTVRLLNLPKIVQKFVMDHELSSGHARALLSIDNMDLLTETAKRVIENNLSVREAEALVTEIHNKKKKKELKKKTKDSTLMFIEDTLKGILGTKVNIVKGKKKGKIEIEYYGDEELERLIEIIQGR